MRKRKRGREDARSWRQVYESTKDKGGAEQLVRGSCKEGAMDSNRPKTPRRR